MRPPMRCSMCGHSDNFWGGQTTEVHGLCVECYNRDLAQHIDYVESEVRSLIERAEGSLEYVEDSSVARLAKWQRFLNP